MRYTTSLVLLAAVLLLGAYILIFERSGPTTDERKEQEKQIFSLDEEKIQEITIKSDRGEVRLTRKEDEWEVTSPGPFPGDKTVLDGLASRLAHLEAVRRVDGVTQDKLGNYSLDSPVVTVSFKSPKGETSFVMGGQDTTKRRVFLAVKGSDQVQVVEKDVLEAFHRDPSEFRERKLLSLDAPAVTGLTLRKGGQEILVAAREKGRWSLSRPYEIGADQGKMEELIGDLLDLKAESFVEDAPKELGPYGLDSPAIEVILKGGEKEEHLLIGARKEEGSLFAQGGSGGVVTLKESQIEPLQRPSFGYLVQRKLLSFQEMDVDWIEVGTGEGATRLERKDDQWSMIRPMKMEKVDEDQVKDLLKRLEEGEIIEVVSGGQEEASLETPLARVALGSGEKTLATLLVGSARGSHHLARRNQEKALVLVAGDLIDLLDPSPRRFKDRQVLEMERYKLREITLSLPERRREVLSKSSDGDWLLKEPLEAKPDSTGLDHLLDKLSSLKAHSFPEGDPPLQGETLVVTWKVREEKEGAGEKTVEGSLEVVIAPVEVRGKPLHLAHLPGEKVTFYLSDEDYKELASTLVSRDLWAFPSTDVQGITLTTSEKVELRFRDKAWHMVYPDSREVKRESVRVLLDEISALRAEEFRSFGDSLKAPGFEKPYLTLKVSLKDGKEKTLVLGDVVLEDQGEESRPLGRLGRVDNLDAVFLLKSSIVERLDRKESDFPPP